MKHDGQKHPEHSKVGHDGHHKGVNGEHKHSDLPKHGNLHEHTKKNAKHPSHHDSYGKKK